MKARRESAQYGVRDFAMDYGEVIHDYLAKKLRLGSG